MQLPSISKLKSRRGSASLVTLWFLVSACALIGLIVYFLMFFGPRGLTNTVNLPNYWGFVFLFIASGLGAREQKKGWWLGMVIGGYFLLSGGFSVFSPILQMFKGTLTLQSDVTSLIRFLFGCITIYLLKRKVTMNEFGFGSFSPSEKKLVFVTAGSFSLALYCARLLFFGASFWLSVAFGFDLKTITGIFTAENVPFFCALYLFPAASGLMDKKKWAYHAILIMWSAITAWSFVSVIEMFTNFSRLWVAPIFGSPLGMLGVGFGSVFLFWLLQIDVLEVFGISKTERKKKVGLSIITVSVFALIVSVAKFSTVPLLSDMFLF